MANPEQDGRREIAAGARWGLVGNTLQDDHQFQHGREVRVRVFTAGYVFAAGHDDASCRFEFVVVVITPFPGAHVHMVRAPTGNTTAS